MAAAGERAQEMMDALEAHLATYAEESGRVSLQAEYLLVSARNR